MRLFATPAQKHSRILPFVLLQDLPGISSSAAAAASAASDRGLDLPTSPQLCMQASAEADN